MQISVHFTLEEMTASQGGGADWKTLLARA